MEKEILDIILKYIVPLILGYCLNVIRNYRKKNNAIKNALLIMLQSNVTNAYFIYEKEKKILDYVYKNWLSELAVYEDLGGDDYIHTLAEKMKSWEIVHTDVLKN